MHIILSSKVLTFERAINISVFNNFPESERSILEENWTPCDVTLVKQDVVLTQVLVADEISPDLVPLDWATLVEESSQKDSTRHFFGTNMDSGPKLAIGIVLD